MDSKSFNIDSFLRQLNEENRPQKFTMFICGVLLYSIAFSIFFSPREIVTGGTTGLSLIIYDLFKIDHSVTVFVASLILLILGLFLLDIHSMLKTVLGIFLLPIFMQFGDSYVTFLNFQDSSLFLMVVFGGIMMGLGNGMIIRSGYSVGGVQTLYQIFYKYFGISIGKSTLIVNGILIFASSFFFGITNALYAIIGLYISSVITDKVMLETSSTKTFYIVTNKAKDISQYIVEEMGCNVTEVDAKGGYSNQNKKVLMCAVSTREYYHMKEVVERIDQNVFFLITDTYEIYGGHF